MSSHMITEASRSVDLLWQALIERGPLYFQEDSRISTSFHFFASRIYIKLTGVGDKSIGASFIEIHKLFVSYY